jgi:hypothetical protein
MRTRWFPRFRVLLSLRPAVIFYDRRGFSKLESPGSCERKPFSANRIFILFNHAILTDAIKRKLAPEKRRPNVRASKGV